MQARLSRAIVDLRAYVSAVYAEDRDAIMPITSVKEQCYQLSPRGARSLCKNGITYNSQEVREDVET